ncbi:unnamed protein product, partial [Ixodes hexagonus]
AKTCLSDGQLVLVVDVAGVLEPVELGGGVAVAALVAADAVREAAARQVVAPAAPVELGLLVHALPPRQWPLVRVAEARPDAAALPLPARGREHLDMLGSAYMASYLDVLPAELRHADEGLHLEPADVVGDGARVGAGSLDRRADVDPLLGVVVHHGAHVVHGAAHDAVNGEGQDGALGAVGVDQVVAAVPDPVLQVQVLAVTLTFIIAFFLLLFQSLTIFFLYQGTLTAALLFVLVVLSGAVSMSIADGVLGNAGAVVALEGHVYRAPTLALAFLFVRRIVAVWKQVTPVGHRDALAILAAILRSVALDVV